MSASRAAVAPLTGYAYQFDLSILAILRARPGESVTVEGVEDIDIFSSDTAMAVQCKYYSSREYALTSLRSAILPMLDAFTAGRRWKYRLHVYFQTDGDREPHTLTLDELKFALTEHKRRPVARTVLHFEQWNDVELRDFLDNFEIVHGLEIEAQKVLVHSGLAAALGCSVDDTRELFYGNALTAVLALATKHDEAKRTTTREAFLASIDRKSILFTRWHRELLGETRFSREVRRMARAGSLLSAVRWRVLVVDQSAPWLNGGPVNLNDVALRLAREDYGPGKLSTAKPWTIAVEADEALLDLKRFLLSNQLDFNDGGEMIEFQPELFGRAPVVQTAGRGSKIQRASYSIRVSTVDSLRAFVIQGGKIDTLVSVSVLEPAEFKAGTTIHLPGFSPVAFTQITELKQ
jgi:hypothetical protein